jgi:hypothetical protein
VELSRIAGQFPTDHMCESDSGENWDEQDEDASSNGHCTAITCRVSIHQVNNPDNCLLFFIPLIFVIFIYRSADCRHPYRILFSASIICSVKQKL